ncbi:hypothetical protein [Paenibacillus tengchongensis]|uniref:hypothetical protein n=1 Tax=Paenibacillus tengchongensis TaxID=2608684 RepID=UPI00124BE624|nr:hypothetical protein [Paenibacillus tengchongensis]
MSRIGRRLAVAGIWAGVGLLIGLQFGSGGTGAADAALPAWNEVNGTLPYSPSAGTLPSAASGQAAKGEQNGYVYVPVVIDPDTGAYTLVPARQPVSGNTNGTGKEQQAQQEIPGYSTLSPEQILIPDDRKPTVDRLADKTAGLLQHASQKGIRWVVSLFASAED